MIDAGDWICKPYNDAGIVIFYLDVHLDPLRRFRQLTRIILSRLFLCFLISSVVFNKDREKKLVKFSSSVFLFDSSHYLSGKVPLILFV